MAESFQEIDLNDALNFTGEASLRPIDRIFDQYAHSGAPENKFDEYARILERSRNARDQDGILASVHVGAAVGAMMLRAEANTPGARAAWHARHDAVANMMTKKGGVVMSMVSTMGDAVEGAGSILGLYIATNAADPNPDFSVFKTPAHITITDRISQARNKGASRNFGPTPGGGEVWSSGHVADICRGHLQKYLEREQRLRLSDPDAIIAAAYGAIVLRTGALARFHKTHDAVMERHIEDFVSAASRLRRGRGDSAVLSELNPLYTRMYMLGAALMNQAGIKIRTWNGPVDGAVQAAKTMKGLFTTSTTKFGKYTSPEKAQKTVPKEFQDPMTARHRPGSRTHGGGLPPRPEPGSTSAQTAASRPAVGSPRPRMAAAKPSAEFTPTVRELVRRPLAVMVASDLQREMEQAAKRPQDYPQWAELFAASRLRIHGQRANSQEVKYFDGNHDVVARLALRQLVQTGTVERLELGDEVPAETYAGVVEVRRWLELVARGRVQVKNYSPEQARGMARRLAIAQERRVRREYGVPDHVKMTPSLFETLNELHILDLSRIMDDPKPHGSLLKVIAARIVDAMKGIHERDLPAGAEKTYWQRTERAMNFHHGIRPQDLPPIAYEQYQRLRREAGGTIFPADWK